MHGALARPWTLEQLCASVAMSRSAFSKRFKTLAGHAPLDYLLRQGVPVSKVALDVGYASASAFRHAFRRRYDHAPGRYWQTVNVNGEPARKSARRDN